MFLKTPIIAHLLAKKSGHLHLPKRGIYYPSMLVQSCPMQQWLHYVISQREGKLPEDFLLRTYDGQLWHEEIQSIKGLFDKVEIPVSMRIKLSVGNYITIRGRADAIKGTNGSTVVYELKKTSSIPTKPKFAHVMQLQFYLRALNANSGIISYIGYDRYRNFRIEEFFITQSDWYFEQLVTKAQTLHVLLKDKHNPPRCSCRSKIHNHIWQEWKESRK